MRSMRPEEEEMVVEMQRYAAREPSPEIRARVLRATRYAWEHAAGESDAVRWPAALAPVAASVFAVFLLVVGSGHITRRALAPWQSRMHAEALTFSQAESPWGDFGTYWFVNRPAAQALLTDREQASAIAAYRIRLRELLGTGQAEEAPTPDETRDGSESGSAMRYEAHASLTPCWKGRAS